MTVLLSFYRKGTFGLEDDKGWGYRVPRWVQVKYTLVISKELRITKSEGASLENKPTTHIFDRLSKTGAAKEEQKHLFWNITKVIFQLMEIFLKDG